MNMRWAGFVPRLRSHFSSRGSSFKSQFRKKYPYLETVHPEDMSIVVRLGDEDALEDGTM